MGTPVRWIVAGIVFAISSAAVANGLDTWSITENRLGVVTATGPAPPGNPRQPSDFKLLFENNREIPGIAIEAAAPSVPETFLVLCVDHSASMSMSIVEIKKALGKSLQNALSRPTVPIKMQVLGFSTALSEAAEFLNDEVKVLQAVDALPIETARDGKTKLYDAIAEALKRLRNGPDGAMKRVIIISDGKDEGSNATLEAISDTALRLEAHVDSIGYGRLARVSSSSLVSLAKATNSKFFFAKNAEELSALLDSLLNPALPSAALPAAVRVTFNYQPAVGKSRAKSIRLVYAPRNNLPIEQTIQLQSAIASPSAAPASRGNSGKLSANDIILYSILAVILVLILVFVALSRKKKASEMVPEDQVYRPSPIKQRPTRPGTRVLPSFSLPKRGQPVAFLLCQNGQNPGHRYPIEKEFYRIGASANNDLVLSDDEYISTIHACIRYDHPNLYVEDLGSANGTYLNDFRLSGSPMTLGPGDQIRVGKTTLELQAG